MGMLMHHTWLKQQEEAKAKKAEAKPVVEKKEPVKVEEPTPVKKPGRRKVTK